MAGTISYIGSVPFRSYPSSRDMKGKPHVVNGQRLKHYIAGKSFIGTVEKLNLQTPEEVIERGRAVSATLNQ